MDRTAYQASIITKYYIVCNTILLVLMLAVVLANPGYGTLRLEALSLQVLTTVLRRLPGLEEYESAMRTTMTIAMALMACPFSLIRPDQQTIWTRRPLPIRLGFQHPQFLLSDILLCDHRDHRAPFTIRCTSFVTFLPRYSVTSYYIVKLTMFTYRCNVPQVPKVDNPQHLGLHFGLSKLIRILAIIPCP